MPRQSTKFNTRQYMLSRDFEVYYYSDVHFQSVGSHSHDYYEFYFFVEGKVTMQIGDERRVLRQGDVICVPPGVRHHMELTAPEVPYRRFVLWCSVEFCEALLAQTEDFLYMARTARTRGRYVRHFDVLTFNAIRAGLFALLDEIHTERFGRSTQIELSLRQLLLQLSRLCWEQDHKTSRKVQRSKYEAITGYIDNHLDSPLTLDQIAENFYLSKYYVAHLFRESTGLSVHQYVTKKRLAACRDAILSGTAVGEAMAVSGFSDYSSFYRAFRKEYGVSPSEYRELNPGQE